MRAWCDGLPVDLGQPRSHEVLAVLPAAAGRTVSMPLLVDAVWDEGDRPSRPEHSVRTHVWRLRRASARHTAEPLLVTVGDGGSGGYALRVSARAVDTWAFERAAARAEEIRASGGTAGQAREVLTGALELWTGEPLAGLHGPHARTLRARLQRKRQSLLEARLALDAELGDRPHLACGSTRTTCWRASCGGGTSPTRTSPTTPTNASRSTAPCWPTAGCSCCWTTRPPANSSDR